MIKKAILILCITLVPIILGNGISISDEKPIYNNLLVYRPSEDEIQIYNSLPDNNTIMLKILKKDWGTWNIEGWFIALDNKIPTKKPYAVAAGDTDWEYVFRAAYKLEQPLQFSGGNHGNEYLRSIDFIKDDDKTIMNLMIGKQYPINKLKIIENTSLTIDDDILNKYADVERVYTFLPSKIILDTEFCFIKDTYMGTSYVCMFPVIKDYGQFIKFIDTDNIYSTPKTGETLTANGFENFIGKEKTYSTEIWGKVNPNYRFKVKIEDKEMVDDFNNDLKVFYWDLNKNSNKLYFSKYNTDEYRKINLGTVWNHSQTWEIDVKNN